MRRQKAVTKTFFDRVASEWYRRTYDPSGRFESFPGNRVRKDLTLDQIASLRVRGDILDIGCGPGALVIDLTRRGHTTFGIDISEQMIDQARSAFRKTGLGDGEDVFRLADLATFAPKRTFAAVTALGVLEYLERDAELFRALARLTASGGYAFVEARNKLFNLYSANAYTVHAAKTREVTRLVDELQTVGRFSPLPDTSIPTVEREVAARVARFFAGLRRRGEERAWSRPARRPRFVPFPQHMKRRQHTPADLARSAERHGFRCEYVVYWHCHPFPPRYESLMPRIYNRLSLLLGPLGYTSVGAWCGSSMVAVLRKA